MEQKNSAIDTFGGKLFKLQYTFMVYREAIMSNNLAIKKSLIYC